MRFIFLLGFVTLNSYLYGQRQPTIKLYQNLDIYNISTKRLIPNDNKTFPLSSGYTYHFNRKSIAFSWNLKNKYSNEITLSLSKSPAIPHNYTTRFINSSDWTRVYTSIRYMINKRLNKNKLIRYHVGIGQTFYYYGVWDAPLGYHKTLEENFGLRFEIVPRMNVRVSNRIGLEIGLIIPILDIRRYEYLVDNPQIFYESRFLEQWTRIKFFSESFNFHIGLTYLIGKWK